MTLFTYLIGFAIAVSGLFLKNPAVVIFGLFVLYGVFVNVYVNEREASE